MSLKVIHLKRTLLLACATATFSLGNIGNADTLVIEANKDTSLYSEGTLSNGQGISIFAGRTKQGNDRRGLVQFNLEGLLPANAVVDSVSLSMYVSKVPIGGGPDTYFRIHRLTRDWGEGASNAGDVGGKGAAAEAGDATWLESELGVQAWTQPGGDYVATESAEEVVSGLGFYNWMGDGLLADVNAWLQDPASNFGWIIVGENSLGSAARFESRHYWNDVQRPQLIIEYTTASMNTWAGYPIEEDGVSVDTGDFLGWINIQHDPWIWVYSLGKYVYMPSEGMLGGGSWTWLP
ncbi:MAG: DNRLRE domain-containing protein [Puniceicoccaceae bacterium]